MSLPVYIIKLIGSLSVWHEGRITDFLRVTLPLG
jgi:hypothetical protein